VASGRRRGEPAPPRSEESNVGHVGLVHQPLDSKHDVFAHRVEGCFRFLSLAIARSSIVESLHGYPAPG
jgi:hypothetical protein